MNRYDPKAMRERLAKVLTDKQLSMRHVSLGAGLSETFVHGVLKLERDPGVLNLTKICDFLEVPLAQLMYGHTVGPEEEELLTLLQQNPSKRAAILALLKA